MRHYVVSVVVFGFALAACTAILGDFEVTSSGGPGTDDGGDGSTNEGSAGVVITPTEAKLGIFRPFTFQASGDVTWSVQEGPAGGQVDDKGKYASPGQPGVYHVVATLKSDPSIKATAAITVVPLGVSIVAGQPGGAGNVDGVPNRARFRQPGSMAGARVGNNDVIVIADTGNSTIRRWDQMGGKVITLAGTPNVPGNSDGTGPAARFQDPSHLVLSQSGTEAWFADRGNSCIRHIDLNTGVVTTYAGLCGTPGHVGGIGTAARFNSIIGMARGPQNRGLYVCETEGSGTGNFRGIRRVDLGDKNVTDVISGMNSCDITQEAFNSRIWFTDGGNNAKAKYFVDQVPLPVPPPVTEGATLPETFTRGLATVTGCGGSNELYAISSLEPLIYKWTLTNATFDANPFVGAAADSRVVDGPLAQGRFGAPESLHAECSSSNMYAADRRGHVIRRINLNNNTITTALGSPQNLERLDGPRNVARLIAPAGIALDDGGNVFIADIAFERPLNNTIRKYDASSTNIVLQSGKPVRAGQTPPADGPKEQAVFGLPFDLVRVKDDLYVVDVVGNAIRKVSIPTGEAKTLAGELGVKGNSEGVGAAAHFSFFDSSPGGAFGGAITTDGTNLYVVDSGNYSIRKVVIATGEVSTLAGGSKGSNNGTGAAAQFQFPMGITFENGLLYIADAGDHTIRQLDPNTKVVSSFIGLSQQPGAIDGDASKATFTRPFRLIVDGIGGMYVAETPFAPSGAFPSGVIRRIDIKSKTVTGFAGERGKLGVGTGPLPSTLNCPSGMAVDKNGDLYFGDVCEGMVGVIKAL